MAPQTVGFLASDGFNVSQASVTATSGGLQTNFPPPPHPTSDLSPVTRGFDSLQPAKPRGSCWCRVTTVWRIIDVLRTLETTFAKPCDNTRRPAANTNYLICRASWKMRCPSCLPFSHGLALSPTYISFTQKKKKNVKAWRTCYTKLIFYLSHHKELKSVNFSSIYFIFC